MIDKTELIALLGRPLTTIEDTNFNTYIDIAGMNLEDMLCTPLEEVTETRVFDIRSGYRTAFVDIFWNVTEVKVDGTVRTDYQKRQWDRRNGSWYNALVFDDLFTTEQEIEVTASWGFTPASGGSSLPLDLQGVLAGLFAQITKKNKYDGTIASKQVEDFRISFNADTDLDTEFKQLYGQTISKYSMCDVGNLQHGETGSDC